MKISMHIVLIVISVIFSWRTENEVYLIFGRYVVVFQ